MTFRSEKIPVFRDLMIGHSHRIREFNGCEYLRIVQDERDPRVFFTYSHWRDAAALEAYRRSDLFDEIWTATKAMFDDKPRAWSTHTIIEQS